jgi:mannose-1-phosphate guanylyltransferase
MLHAMIMAGGGGTRFWPRSRAARPKQFLALAGERTLVQQACDRLEAQVQAANTWVITSEAHADETRRQLPQLPAANVVGEPCGRDTAACIGLGAALIARRDPDAVMIVTPADHVIEPTAEFARAVRAATLVIEEHPTALVTFGIVPTFPSTGYGYIHRGAEIERRQNVPAFRVAAFREKPAFEQAEKFIASGEYFWNSGIFVWKAATILGELRKHKPALAAGVDQIAAAWPNENVLREVYPRLEKTSIDFAVMEHAADVLVLQAPYKWDDVGSWLALERMHAQDADGNTVMATHVGLRTKNCVIAGDPGRLIATLGVQDLLIIQDGDATLVADRRDEGNVKLIVEKLKQEKRDQYL